MLARVVVKSDHGFRGDRVLHYYDFIDMRPYVDDDSIFDPCAVYPTGAALAGNCTCAGAEVEKNGMGLAAVAGIVFVILLPPCAPVSEDLFFGQDTARSRPS